MVNWNGFEVEVIDYLNILYTFISFFQFPSPHSALILLGSE